MISDLGYQKALVGLSNHLKGSSYIQLPSELRNSTKGLINTETNDNKCFRWCHIRHMNPQESNSQKIQKTEKNMLTYWIIQTLNFQYL